MKKHLFLTFLRLVALLLSICTLASCHGKIDNTTDSDSVESLDYSETTSETNDRPVDQTTNEMSSESISETEAVSEKETMPPIELEGEHAGLIELGHKLSNGVTAYYTDGSRSEFNLQNKQMTVSYSVKGDTKRQVTAIRNTKGKSYVEDTLDLFVRMKDGNVFYASDSSSIAAVNLYRLGYYYYEGLFEFQNFIPSEIDVTEGTKVRVQRPDKNSSNQVKLANTDDGVRITVTDSFDPYFVYSGLNVNADKENVMSVTMKSSGLISSIYLYFATEEEPFFDENKKLDFTVKSDGEYDTYTLYMPQNAYYKGRITALRFDLSGAAGDSVEIKDISFGSTEFGEVPFALSTSRRFHVYSDKMHHVVQFAATQETKNVASLGMFTAIDADTVEKIFIKDKNGEHYSLDAIDWASVECVGFDIKTAGVFGFIYPDENFVGEIKVTFEDNRYIIEQEIVPAGNRVIPSEKGTVNGNDIYLGQRIYTDETHNFDGLIRETYIELNPLTDEHITVIEREDHAEYLGYDAMRGIYRIGISGPMSGFYEAYNIPNKQYRANFTVSTDKLDRNIYIMSAWEGGSLECAALLDDRMMMLPVPIEVIKNFSELVGDRNLYNLDDVPFSEAIFCIPLKTGEKYEYNILNLYQNWGRFPLKQISGIPFSAPFYHLSTGVTETNCILPWFTGGTLAGKGSKNNTLTDFRSMSAPFWKTQPQHNSCGAHSWLEYTDSNDNFIATENKKNTITSYGPTYAELVMENISDDGKIAVTYTHMEMPQTDENRTYYTMEYIVLEDVTIKDFKRDFQFYDVTDNDYTGSYKRLGYLNENNESVVTKNSTSGEKIYVLGDKCPYFSMFEMPDWDRDNENCEGYANVSFMVYKSSFIIGGKQVTPSFVIINENDHVRISLDLDEVTLKKGDRFTIQAILMPWGSQELEGRYDTVQDEQVREVRRNTLLDPLTVTSDTDEVIESTYLPKIRSKDGKTATFTLFGGENNVAVRVYGFDKLTVPIVERLENGKWVEHVLSSKDTPDKAKNYHYYDGYSVSYDGDGTYSYSFVTSMTDVDSVTFRISAKNDFEGWPEEETGGDCSIDHLNIYTDSNELLIAAQGSLQMFSEVKVSEDKSYVTFNASGTDGAEEAYMNVYKNTASVESGRYLVVKYRVPKSNPQKLNHIEVFTSTVNFEATGSDSLTFSLFEDGEWHLAVLDLSKMNSQTFTADKDGKYYAKYFRFDLFNVKLPDSCSIDIAYIGMDPDLKRICELNAEEFKTLQLYNGKSSYDQIDTATGKIFEKQYLDPNSGYSKSQVAYGAILDSINGVVQPAFFTSSKAGITIKNNLGTLESAELNICGWCGADGGIEKYVWSADGGKTWTAFDGNLSDAYDAIIDAAQEQCGKIFSDREAAKKNAAFQSIGITADLSEYSGQTVEITIGAIPASDTEGKSIILMYHLTGVVVP